MAKRPTKKSKTGRLKGASAPSRRSQVAVEQPASESTVSLESDVTPLVRDIGEMIDAARNQLSITANATLTGLYW